MSDTKVKDVVGAHCVDGWHDHAADVLDHAVLGAAQQLVPVAPLALVLALEEEVVDGARVGKGDLELGDERVGQRNLRMLVSDHVAEELVEFGAAVRVTGCAY